MQIPTDLSKYDNSGFDAGAGQLKRGLWFVVNACFFISYNPFNSLKLFLLRLFGAEVGTGVVIKPGVNIKYPWKLNIGNYVWIGEKVWIDNLDRVEIGNSVCISQGAMLLCGNHDYKKSTFDLITGKIILEDGVWIGAKAIVCPGVTCFFHSVLTVNSVASKNMESNSVYTGNPAIKIKDRSVSNSA